MPYWTVWLALILALGTGPGQANSDPLIDTCESHYDSNFDLIALEACTMDQPYCCGSCSNRTCCADISKRLVQNECTETCLAHFDYMHSYQSNIKCLAASPYCCGTCGGRFCCSTSFLRLNQTSCAQTCNSYISQSGNYFPKEKCPDEAPYCCGDCRNRYCCSNEFSTLNQNACSEKSTKHPSANLTTSSSHSFTEYLIIFIIFFVILTVISNYKINSRPPSQRSFSTNHYQRGGLGGISSMPISITSPRGDITSSHRPSSASSNSSSSSTVAPAPTARPNETSNGASNFRLFQCSYEDTPPAYESLKFDEPKEGPNAAKPPSTNDSSNA